MRGGQVFIESLVAHDVECIFGNPGTTENSVLDRLVDAPQISYYVALHESIAVCAANFYAQASGRTPVVNLHVAPGLGNGIGMLYGALKARSPMVVTAGQQDTRMRLREPILGHDLVAIATPVTKWAAEPRTADEVGPVLRRAFKLAAEPPRGPVFVALPVDVMEQHTEMNASTSGNLNHLSLADPEAIEQLAAWFATSTSPAIIAGDDVVTEGAYDALISIAERVGAAVWTQGLRTRMSFPNNHPNGRGGLPFETSGIARALAGHDLIVLMGGPFFEELWFDDAPAIPNTARVAHMESDHGRLALNHPVDLGLVGNLRATLDRLNRVLEETIDETFAAVAQERSASLGANQLAAREAAAERLERQGDAMPMSPSRALQEISQALPANTIVVDESITASNDVATRFDYRGPDDYFGCAGGGIGQGIAGALGVQVAQPHRRVLCISGDGSAMYSIQALWTAAHHQLPIVFVILSNREYRILKHNMDTYRQRFDAMSNRPYPHMDLAGPTLGFCDMAAGMGVAAERLTRPDEIPQAVTRAFEHNAPYLLDIEISGKR